MMPNNSPPNYRKAECCTKGVMMDYYQGFVAAEMKRHHQMWEEKLQLVVKPKPKWIPLRVWMWILNKVMVQVVQK